jgi:hypothetical protein
VRGFDIGAEAKEYVSRLACRVFLAPDPAIAEIRDGADAIAQRYALVAVGLIFAPLTRRITDFDIGQRQVVAIEQLGDLGGG